MSDLTKEEQNNVRVAVRFLRARCGGPQPLAKALRLSLVGIRHTLAGATASPQLAFRVARLAGVGVDDLLAGRFPPPGTRPYCGHQQA